MTENMRSLLLDIFDGNGNDDGDDDGDDISDDGGDEIA